MRRRVLVTFLALALGAASALAIHLATSKEPTMLSGKRPGNLGVKDGRLASCGRRLNCVCSQGDPGDAQRHVAPIAFRGSPAQAMAAARRAVESTPRARVISEAPTYLYAEFRSRWLGFVDDLEFTFDERAGVLNVRSASRLGRRDFGVNRQRVEDLRARIEARGRG
ncbi:MAG TPA: DUF1499 domain-containing protein [Burkholderiales bacterium]|nr:DUF1499 domain-containing protein [Burkholderiales bacterium]